MKPRFLRNLVLVTAVSLGAAACTDGYGYGGVSYGSGYYDGYGSSSYYASPAYGWYDGWYYPGNGYYVYDNYGKRRRWDDNHRRYWESRRGDGRGDWDRRDRDRRDWDRHDGDRYRRY